MIKNWMFLIILLTLFLGKVSGQNVVNIGIYTGGSSRPNQVDIKIKPNYAESGTHYCLQLGFTVKWLISSGITEISGIKVNPWNLEAQGPPLTDGGYYYQRFVSHPGNKLTWNTNQVIPVHTFDAHTCPVTTFEIADDAFVHLLSVNGAYYFDVSGENKTGSISPVSVAPSSCAQYHYRTVADGNWDDPYRWETSTDLTSWNTVKTYPNHQDLTITVMQGHTITVNSDVNVDQFNIQDGGAVTVLPGVTLNNVSTSANEFVINSSSSLSGSLLTMGTGSVTGPVKYNRWMRDDYYQYFSSPLSGQTFSGWSPGRTATVWEWNEPTALWNSSLSETAFTSGKGYSWGANGTAGTVPFVGNVINSATISASSPYVTGAVAGDDRAQYDVLALVTGRSATDATWGAGGWNLLGNPFTSALDATLFISTNAASFDPNYQAVYIYAGNEGTEGVYYYIGVDGGDWVDNQFAETYVQSGQGFFVLSRNNSSSFSFSNDMQVHATWVEMKSAKTPTTPGIRLKAQYEKGESSTLVVFNDGMTPGLDPGYDIGLLSSGQTVELYTALVKDNGFDFTRQALPLAGSDNLIIPVGVNAKDGGKVTFSALAVPVANSSFYLEDRVKGTFTEMGSNTYTVTLPEKTAGTGRFFIHTSIPTVLHKQINRADELNLRIWSANQMLNIKGSVSNKAVTSIFDLLGRKIMEIRLTDAQLNTIPVPEIVKGVYLVKVTDGESVLTQKVVF